MKKFLSSGPLWPEGILLFRLIIGYVFIKNGIQVFDDEQMKGYVSWSKELGFFPPAAWAYAGKITELAGGVLLAAGLITRFATIPLAITMAVITFKFHEGKPLNGDEFPFFLMLFCLLFFLTGPGRWSADYFLFERKKAGPQE